MRRHAADAAAFGNDDRHVAAGVQRPDAAVDHVAEDEAALVIPDGALDKTIAGCEFLHCHAFRFLGPDSQFMTWTVQAS